MKDKLLVIVIFLVAFFMLLPEPANTEIYDRAFIIRNVQLYDGNQRFEKVDVSIINNKIAEISATLPAQTKVPELNGTGKTLLPGFIDAHTHAYQNALSEAINFGVTTEMDMFTMPEFANAHQTKREQQDNHLIADLFSATILATAPGGHGTQYGFDIPVLSSADQAAQFVTDRIEQGADYIKAVYNAEKAVRSHFPSISHSILEALIKSAHEHDKLLVVHVDNLISAKEAIALGADGIIHSFLDQVVDDEFVKLMIAKKAFIIPTLTVESSVMQQSTGRTLIQNDFNFRYLSKQQRQQLKAKFPDFGIPSKALKKAFNSVLILSNANVPILAGSDAPNPGTTHGLSLHAELELLTQAGLTNEQALHSATGAVGQHFAIGNRGTLSTGVLASMILINGDPFEIISHTQKIDRIWKNGVEFKRVVHDNAAASNEKLKAGLITDFNQNLNETAMGTVLAESTDQFAGGKSVVNLALIEDNYSTTSGNKYLHVSGEIKTGFIFPWSGFAYLLGKDLQNGADLSALSAITFRAKGGPQTNKISVLLFEPGSYRPVQKDVQLTREWQTYRIEFATLNDLDLGNVANISFVRTQVIGEFEFMIDDLQFK